MTLRLASKAETRPQQRPTSLAEWMRGVNSLAASASFGHATRRKISGAATGRSRSATLLMAGPELATGKKQLDAAAGTPFGYRMEHDVAEYLVGTGLDPDFLVELATLSGLESRDVLDFAGIDRTTVSRRKASGSALPQDAAVKALQAIDLMTRATEVFGSPDQASLWLTKAHPLLDGETPLRRARTPWGMSKVQSMLVALRYGGAA